MAMTSAAVMDGRRGIVAIAPAERHIALTTSPPVIVRPRLAQRERVRVGYRASVHAFVHFNRGCSKAGFTPFNRRAERGKGGIDGAFHGGGEAGGKGAHAGVRGPAVGEGGV